MSKLIRKRRSFKDPFPRLPPGCTPSDIDEHFGAEQCPACGNYAADGHADDCDGEAPR